ncbi:hypothetical protein MCNF_43320 [Mycolicibacterium confluentis]|uniref:Uncharacterized protein n=1 Tax=Mycolicibacterium confluentis TaxID=28047 RepID=A0A7I7Y292_9MYCO|nr:hypothetical protein MCNF_43320 [Mycolicibacterium confluentis]
METQCAQEFCSAELGARPVRGGGSAGGVVAVEEPELQPANVEKHCHHLSTKDSHVPNQYWRDTIEITDAL